MEMLEELFLGTVKTLITLAIAVVMLCMLNMERSITRATQVAVMGFRRWKL
jgi:hypothetical protein